MRTINRFTVKKLFVWLILILTSSCLKSSLYLVAIATTPLWCLWFWDVFWFWLPRLRGLQLPQRIQVAKPSSEAEVERGLAQLNMVTLADFEEMNRGYKQHARIQEVWAWGDVCAKCVLTNTSIDIYYGVWYMVYMGYKVYNIWGIWYTHQIRSSNLCTTLCARTPKICCTGCPWRVPYYLSTSVKVGHQCSKRPTWSNSIRQKGSGAWDCEFLSEWGWGTSTIHSHGFEEENFKRTWVWRLE